MAVEEPSESAFLRITAEDPSESAFLRITAEDPSESAFLRITALGLESGGRPFRFLRGRLRPSHRPVGDRANTSPGSRSASVPKQIEGLRIHDKAGGHDVQLTERQFERPGFTVVHIAAGVSSATIELHQGYYTYYWRCSFGPEEFVRRIRARQDATVTSVTVVDEKGAVEQLPLTEANKSIFSRLGERDFTLLRFDGPERSWVWQFAPDDTARESNDDAHAAYAGCASIANHVATFAMANEFIAVSALDSDNLLRHVHLLEQYLHRWEQSDWTVQA